MNSKIRKIKIILGSLAGMLAIGAGVSSADSHNRNLGALGGEINIDLGYSGADNKTSGSKKKAKRKAKKKAKRKAKRKTKRKTESD